MIYVRFTLAKSKTRQGSINIKSNSHEILPEDLVTGASGIGSVFAATVILTKNVSLLILSLLAITATESTPVKSLFGVTVSPEKV